MRIGPHKHRCDDCKQPTECCGDIEQNFDGFPEWICREYETFRGRYLCGGCADKADAAYKADLAEQELES